MGLKHTVLEMLLVSKVIDFLKEIDSEGEDLGLSFSGAIDIWKDGKAMGTIEKIVNEEKVWSYIPEDTK